MPADSGSSAQAASSCGVRVLQRWLLRLWCQGMFLQGPLHQHQRYCLETAACKLICRIFGLLPLLRQLPSRACCRKEIWSSSLQIEPRAAIHDAALQSQCVQLPGEVQNRTLQIGLGRLTESYGAVALNGRSPCLRLPFDSFLCCDVSRQGYVRSPQLQSDPIRVRCRCSHRWMIRPSCRSRSNREKCPDSRS